MNDNAALEPELALCIEKAYYVEWHMREAWSLLLFADNELAERARTRDLVAPAEPSASSKRQKATRRAEDGTPLHSFRTLLEDLANVTRQSEFELDTRLSAEQARALELLKGIRPLRSRSLFVGTRRTFPSSASA